MTAALAPLENKVCQFAIRNIKQELYFAWGLKDARQSEDTCGCKYSVNYRLPCKHTLPRVKGTPVDISVINQRWFLKIEAPKGNIVHAILPA